jgi:hypothetical protein
MKDDIRAYILRDEKSNLKRQLDDLPRLLKQEDISIEEFHQIEAEISEKIKSIILEQINNR